MSLTIYLPESAEKCYLFSTPYPAFLGFTLCEDGPSDWWEMIPFCSVDLHHPPAWLAKKGVCFFPEYIQEKSIRPFWPRSLLKKFCPFPCAFEESPISLWNPVPAILPCFKSFFVTYLKAFFHVRYLSQSYMIVNCSAFELHFSTCFLRNWPQNSRIASSPILVPRASWAFDQFLFLIGN